MFFQIAAISEQSSQSGTDEREKENENVKKDNSQSGSTQGWKSFDMRSVVASTEELFRFILSEKGWRVRVFLIQDIINASDAFLQEAAYPCFFEKEHVQELDPEVC